MMSTAQYSTETVTQVCARPDITLDVARNYHHGPLQYNGGLA